MARRALQVLGALAVIAVVAVAARPPAPDVAPPFTVERVTPSPAPAVASPSPSSSPSPSPEAEPPGPAPVPAAGRGTLTIHLVDGRTLHRRGESVTVPVRPGYLHTELSPDGRLLAVATARSQPDVATLVRLYDTAELGDAPRELVVRAFADWMAFTPDSSAVVWLESRVQGLQHVGGARVGAVAGSGGGGVGVLGRVRLPGEARVHSVAALERDRVGLVVLTAGPDGSRELLGVRLLVADLATGQLAADLALPVAHAVGAGGSRGTDLLPGVAWDVAGDRLYVAHAGRDAITVVDLAGPHVVAELGGAAAASEDVAGGGAWRRALLSADGAMLYVHGASSGVDNVAGGVLPLLAVDLEAGQALAVDEPPMVRAIDVDPSGEHVAVVAGTVVPVPDLTLQVLDGRTLEERWSLPLDEAAPPWVRFSRDGDVLAVARPAEGRAPPSTRVELFAAATGETLATGGFDGLLMDFHPEAGLVLVRSLD